MLDVASLKVMELRKELRARGLSAAGDKADLADRLRAALEEEALDHELGLGIASPSAAHSLTLASLESHPAEETEPELLSPTLSPPTPTLVPAAAVTAAASEPAKKIVLNRTAVVAPPSPPSATPAISAPTPTATATPVTKLTMDSKTRLEMRAKRFGLSPVAPAAPGATTADSAKEARKARFGSAAPDTSASLEILKKRAERFGTSVSKVMTEIENKERLEKRKQKFGVIKA